MFKASVCSAMATNVFAVITLGGYVSIHWCCTATHIVSELTQEGLHNRRNSRIWVYLVVRNITSGCFPRGFSLIRAMRKPCRLARAYRLSRSH